MHSILHSQSSPKTQWRKCNEIKSSEMADVEISTVNIFHTMLKSTDKKLLKIMYFTYMAAVSALALF